MYVFLKKYLRGEKYLKVQCPAVHRMMYLQFKKNENKQAKKSIKTCIVLLKTQFGRFFLTLVTTLSEKAQEAAMLRTT